MAKGSWKTSSRTELLRVVEALSKSSGVREITIVPGRVDFVYRDGTKPNPMPGSPVPLTWDQISERIELREYKAKSLASCLLYGWAWLRGSGRYPTHLFVWDREGFYSKLFPSDSWYHDMPIADRCLGMELIVGVGFEDGAVVMAGGVVDGADSDAIDRGLILRHGAT